MDSTTVSGHTLAPVFTGTSNAGVSSVKMGGDFRNTFMMQNGFRLITTLGVDKEEFRLQARSNENKKFHNTLVHQLGRGWSVDMKHMDNRTFNRVSALDGGFQDVILNTLTLGAGIRHVTLAPDNFRWDFRANGALADAEKTFKTDKSYGGEIGGGAALGFLNRWLVLRARGYKKDLTAQSEAPDTVFTGLYLREDSVAATAVVNFTDEQIATFDYAAFDSEEKYTDQRRGASGVQKTGSEFLFPERRTVEARLTRVAFSSVMFKKLDMKVDAQRSENITDYDSTKTRFSRNITNQMRSDVSYSMTPKTVITAGLETRKALKDLGQESLSSYNQRNRKVELGLRHTFRNNSSINISGSMNLSQFFYLRYEENPRDRDQLDQRVDFRFTSNLHRKLGATISMVVTKTDFVNIDATLSTSNRVKTRYDLRPVLSYKLNPRITINQSYGLAIEFVDHTFVPEDNFLDRNITFSNEVSARLTERLSGNFYYGFHFHDRGSYLSNTEDGERYLSIDRNDRRDQFKIALNYEITSHVTVVGRQDYSRREDRQTGRDAVRVVEDGGIELGLRGSYAWTQDRTMQFEIRKANRFGRFSTEAQKDYWVVDATIKYAF